MGHLKEQNRYKNICNFKHSKSFFFNACVHEHYLMYFHLSRQDTIHINQLIFGFWQKMDWVIQNIMIDDLAMGTENDLIWLICPTSQLTKIQPLKLFWFSPKLVSLDINFESSSIAYLGCAHQELLLSNLIQGLPGIKSQS